MTFFYQVQGELQVKIRALATSHDMWAELGSGSWVRLAVDGDAAEDRGTVLNTMLHVGLKVSTNVFVFVDVIQGDDGEGQLAGDFLQKRPFIRL